MKGLIDYIKESYVNESEGKTMEFSFNDLEGAKEFLEKVKDFDGVEVDTEDLSLTVNIDNEDVAKSVYAELKKFCDTIRNSSKRTNDETYAQKTLKFKHKVESLYDALYKEDETKEEPKEVKNKEKKDPEEE